MLFYVNDKKCNIGLRDCINFTRLIACFSNTIKLLSMAYIAFLAKGHSSNASLMSALKNGHSLHSGGVPHTDERLLANLTCRHQVLVGVKCQAEKLIINLYKQSLHG